MILSLINKRGNFLWIDVSCNCSGELDLSAVFWGEVGLFPITDMLALSNYLTIHHPFIHITAVGSFLKKGSGCRTAPTPKFSNSPGDGGEVTEAFSKSTVAVCTTVYSPSFSVHRRQHI